MGWCIALADPLQGACGSVVQLADRGQGARRLRVVSGILAQEAADLRADPLAASTGHG